MFIFISLVMILSGKDMFEVPARGLDILYKAIIMPSLQAAFFPFNALLFKDYLQASGAEMILAAFKQGLYLLKWSYLTFI